MRVDERAGRKGKWSNKAKKERKRAGSGAGGSDSESDEAKKAVTELGSALRGALVEKPPLAPFLGDEECTAEQTSEILTYVFKSDDAGLVEYLRELSQVKKGRTKTWSKVNLDKLPQAPLRPRLKEAGKAKGGLSAEDFSQAPFSGSLLPLAVRIARRRDELQNASNRLGESQSSSQRALELASSLISWGIDVDGRSAGLGSALHEALRPFSTNVQQHASEARTPLHEQDLAFVISEKLLLAGANINAVDARGLTPLQVLVSEPVLSLADLHFRLRATHFLATWNADFSLSYAPPKGKVGSKEKPPKAGRRSTNEQSSPVDHRLTLAQMAKALSVSLIDVAEEDEVRRQIDAWVELFGAFLEARLEHKHDAASRRVEESKIEKRERAQAKRNVDRERAKARDRTKGKDWL